MINGQLVMSDTPQEYRDHIAFFGRARGSVLIHGLGLGCALNVLLSMGHVNDITVVEVNPDVI